MQNAKEILRSRVDGRTPHAEISDFIVDGSDGADVDEIYDQVEQLDWSRPMLRLAREIPLTEQTVDSVRIYQLLRLFTLLTGRSLQKFKRGLFVNAYHNGYIGRCWIVDIRPRIGTLYVDGNPTMCLGNTIVSEAIRERNGAVLFGLIQYSSEFEIEIKGKGSNPEIHLTRRPSVISYAAEKFAALLLDWLDNAYNLAKLGDKDAVLLLCRAYTCVHGGLRGCALIDSIRDLRVRETVFAVLDLASAKYLRPFVQ